MKFTPILGEELSGSVGGVTASRNASGAYFRGKTVPSDKFTEAQRASRESMRNIGPDYASLSTVDKQSWIDYAALISFTPVIGSDYNLTGQQMYVRSKLAVKYANELDASLNLVVPDFSPMQPTLPKFNPQVSIFDALLSSGELRISFNGANPWVTEDGAAMFVRMSPPQSPGVSSFSGPYQVVAPLLGSSTSPPISPFGFPFAFPTSLSAHLFVVVHQYRANGALSLAVDLGPVTVEP